ncbi:MAG: hypothetical protein LDL39_05415 [Magnetospirillum sp.]|nr:hypothetical protein [Magnetospirillum sp.]
MKRTVLVLCSGLLLAGCATTFKDPNEVVAGTTSKFDPYAGVQVLNGPMIDTGEFPNITKTWLTAGIVAIDFQG